MFRQYAGPLKTVHLLDLAGKWALWSTVPVHYNGLDFQKVELPRGEAHPLKWVVGSESGERGISWKNA